jgi:hypothetical protein
MTILNVTVSTDFAVISQDSFVAPLPPDVPPARAELAADYDSARRSTFCGDGTPPTARPLAFASKLAIYPHLGIVAGGVGLYGPVWDWQNLLRMGVAAADIDELDAETPRLLGAIRDRMGYDQPFAVCHVGWSRRDGTPVAYLYGSDEGFTPRRLGPGNGHLTHPAPNVGDPGYNELAALWTPALHGEGTEAFHLALARNQHASYLAGLLRVGTGIGGQLHLARIDRDHISARTVLDFPGYDHQRRAVRRDLAESILAGVRTPVDHPGF